MIAPSPVFALVCTGCERMSAAKSSSEKALREARWDGWQVQPPLCVRCLHRAEVAL